MTSSLEAPVSSSSRLLLLSALLAGAAFAQPVNDTCANATVVSSFPHVTPVVSMAGVASAVEAPFSCQALTRSSIWYRFTADVGGTYIITNCGMTQTLSDTVIAVYTGTGCGALTEVAGGCNDDSCSTRSLVSVTLTAGTEYWVQVANYSSAATSTDTMQLLFDRRPSNDTCSVTPAVALNTPLRFSLNNLATDDARVGGGNACYLGAGNSTSTTSNAGPGRDVVFSFTPPSAGTYSVRARSVAGPSADLLVYATDSCTAAMTPPQIYSPPTQCLAASNRTGSSSSAIEEVCVALPASTSYLWADLTSSTNTTPLVYELEVSACFPESEPNDAPATANALACPNTGSISVASEADFYSLGTPGSAARVFALVDGAAGGLAGSGSTDFDLRITTTTDTLEYDDANADTFFGGASATIGGTPLAAGVPAFARVSYFNSNVVGPYRLYAVVQTATPVVEAEPNNTLAAANGGATNYFSGDISSSTDVDLFTFNATAGQLLFVSLDKNPGRTATSVPAFTLALLDANGVVVASAADGATASNLTVTTGSLNASSPTAPAESLVYRARTTGRFYARITRTTTGTTAAPYLLSIASNCTAGGGLGAPTVSLVTPDNGDAVGGNSVVIDGSNFAPGVQVFFGANAATVTSFSATSLTVTVPPGVDGLVDVVVRNASNLVATQTGGYRYNAPVVPPTVTAITPNFGAETGGTAVTIDGTNFKSGAEVRFTVSGTDVAATNVVLVSSTRLTATAPAHLVGLATVTVRNPTDMLEGSGTDLYEYWATPTLTQATPPTGLLAGGTSVTLTGTGFRAGAQVRFGGTLGTAVTVVDPTTLTVTTLSRGTTGAVAVTVTNLDGQVATLANGFTYVFPAPTITTVAPAIGFSSGGASLVITGTNFLTSPTVTIGGVACLNVVRTSSTRITCTTPPGADGAVDVVVTNSDLQSATLPGGFTYETWEAPTLSMVAPAGGLTTGGTAVTLTGTGFRAGAVVRFGTTSGTGVVVVSGTSLTVNSPSRATNGPVNVSVTNLDGQVATLMNAFTYAYPAPTFTVVAPTSGPSVGGTALVLTGTQFLTGATVTVGGVPCLNPTRTSSTRITCTTPPGTPGTADVVVTNPDLQSVTLPASFTFIAAPSLTAMTPNHGPLAGGTAVTLTGSEIRPGATLTIGGVPAFAVEVVNATTVTALTGSNLAGTYEARLVNPDGQVATLPMAFTYDPAPTLSDATPRAGSTAGGAMVRLTGTGFLTGCTVFFGSVPASSVTFVSATEVTAVAPASSVGVVTLTVRNPDGQLAELPRAFRFVAPPTFTAIAPTSGDVSGGTLVRLTGTDFAPGSTVTFGGLAASEVTYVSSTELTALSPANMRGPVDVVLNTGLSTVTLAQAFTYTRGAPSLSQVAPVSSDVRGGVVVTLTGSGFALNATVGVIASSLPSGQLVEATDVVVLSPGLARARLPAHPAGVVDLVLNNPDDAQGATLPNAFTYVATATGTEGLVTDGGSGAVGTEPIGGGGGEGGVSCGCSTFDGSLGGFVGLGLLVLASRRRRR